MVSFKIDNEVLIREFKLDDAEAVFKTVMRNYDHLKTFMHWISPEYSLKSAEDFVAQSIAGRSERKSLGFGIFRKDIFIGSIGFINFDWLAMKTELGYWISAEEEGKGIISKTSKILIDFAFGELKMNRIEIRCAAENTRSAAIPKRLGFQREGLLREVEYRGGRLYDFEIYGLLASDRKLSD